MRATISVLAVMLAGASPAGAQDLANANDALRVFAAAPPSCVVSSAGSASGALNAVFTPDGPGGGSIAISQLVNPETAAPRAARIELALPVVCNAAHRLVVTSETGGLLRAGGQSANRLGPNTFADLLPYSIGVDWGADTLEGSSERTGSIESAQPARNGELRLRIGTAEGGGLLTAGNYSDSITIRFEPAA